MSTSTAPKSDANKSAQLFSKTIRSLHNRRNAPPPIPIPINPISVDMKAMAQKSDTLPLVAVELSNFPPGLTRHDIQVLFRGFIISPGLSLPATTSFAYPFRAFIWLVGENEAKRAVAALNGSLVGGRQLCKEVIVAELADELKIAIVNTAHIYYPLLATRILEVREHTDGPSSFAFLQAREPITVHSEPMVHLQPRGNEAKWELIAGGRADSRGARGQDKSVRLAALKSLQATVEKQGVLKRIWGVWDGSRVLDVMHH
ncbi:hypothetical protein FB567DRAFT_613707 [Paraphoma chrysanthemicola]|uniref:RRM domain-containing protein n=1 Tax=Paraphoma chrysanthemicola TaxID=798071 RepID=A0A8K0RB32_9PLEO|nr:hypothetical protein FB567DRAFT_613707 [Paraphoma chrysanthemicola]